MLWRLKEQADNAPRCAVELADLTIALGCGGSDVSSSICANPAIGAFVDRLVATGGTAIVSETAEFLGAERIVAERSVSTDVSDAILSCLGAEEAMMQSDGVDHRGTNSTQENIEAGLTTLTEKTMGAICKIGSCDFQGCLSFAERPGSVGLYFMDTPFFSPTSLTGMFLGGAQLALFAVGIFNPSGNPLMPTIKVCGNPNTCSEWYEAIDVDVSDLIGGQHGVRQGADRI